jgi:hypothetical protein
VAWGGNLKGQAAVPANLPGAVAIAAGVDHSFALLARAERSPTNISRIVGQAAHFSVRPRVSLAQFSATNLPSGLTIHPTTGDISGTCHHAGTWQATITSANAIIRNTEKVVFEVAPIETTYAAWSASYWPSGGSGATAMADADDDGVANYMEFALSTAPTERTGKPAPAITRDAAGRLVLQIDAANRGSAVRWKAQFSDDLNFAAPVEAQPETLPGAPTGYQTLRFTDPAATPGARRFGRLVVSES